MKILNYSILNRYRCFNSIKTVSRGCPQSVSIACISSVIHITDTGSRNCNSNITQKIKARPFSSLYSRQSITVDDTDSIDSSDKSSYDNRPQVTIFQSDKYLEKFAGKKYNSYTSVQEGGYIVEDVKELEKHCPEGLAGDSKDDFEYIDSTQWMVRDATKILCRLLQEYEKANGVNFGTTASSISSSSIKGKDITLLGLTDRPEWTNAATIVHRYGKRLSVDDTLSGDAKVRSMVKEILNTEHIYNTNKQQSVASKVPTEIILTGDRGVGKSTVLNQVVLEARRKGWLCIFVPNGWDQVQSGSFIEPIGTPPKGTTTTIFDNSTQSANVLRGFWKAHAHQLKEIKLSNPNVLNKYSRVIMEFKEAWNRALSVPGRESLSYRKMREIIEAEDFDDIEDELDSAVLDGYDFMNAEMDTIEGMIRLGVGIRSIAGSIFLDLMDELKQLNDPKYPILVAVDQYNSWEVPSVFYWKDDVVGSRDLCVPHGLNFISKRKESTASWSLKNGICIAATSKKHTEGKKEDYLDVKRTIPLLVTIPVYSKLEYLSAMAMHTLKNQVEDSYDLQELLCYRMNTGSNPHEVRLRSAGFFLPIAVERSQDKFMSAFLGGGQDIDSAGNDMGSGGYDDDDDYDEEEDIIDSVVEGRGNHR